MRVIRWKNSATGVESLNITATGIYFPVGKEDGAFVARYVMAAGGQTASIEDVRSPAGDRVGNPSISVSGTTEVIARNRRSLAYGIAVTAISGTLTATLDDLVVRTNWPDNLGRFTAKEDADAYTYGGTGLDGCGATIAGVPSVYTPGVEWVAQGIPQVRPYELATGDKCSFWLAGSSSTEKCSTINVDPSTSTAEFNEYTDGYWFGVQTRFSPGWRLAWNGGVGGYTTSQIYAKLQTDAASGYSHIVLQLNANELPTGGADYVNSLKCLKFALAKGAQVILVVPHMKSDSTNYAGYEAYQSWCDLQVARFPSSVQVVSHYAAFGRAPISVGYAPDGQHFNAAGAYVAAGAWGRVVANSGCAITDDMDAFGVIIHDFNLSTGTKSNCTATTNSDGSHNVTATANLGNVASPTITVNTSKKYRVFCDYTINNVASDNYSSGARAYIGTTPKRFGVRNSSDASMAVTPGAQRIMGAPFTPSGTSMSLTFYPGGLGSNCTVRRFGLIELP